MTIIFYALAVLATIAFQDNCRRWRWRRRRRRRREGRNLGGGYSVGLATPFGWVDGGSSYRVGVRCLWHGVEQPQTAINSTLLRDCHFDHFSNAFLPPPLPSWHLTLNLIHNFFPFFFVLSSLYSSSNSNSSRPFLSLALSFLFSDSHWQRRVGGSGKGKGVTD